MSVLDRTTPGRTSCLLAVAVALIVAGPAHAQAPEQTPIRFSLDGRIEGPSALFLLPLDRGYYKNEALNVTVDATSTLEPITRVASEHEMGLADTTLHIATDQNPPRHLAIFMVYNRLRPPSSAARAAASATRPREAARRPDRTATTQQWPTLHAW
jgi:NitT/TauT family transport system substrate-binding protein